MVRPPGGYQIAYERAEGRCELCGLKTRAQHRHHRVPRGMGGSKVAWINDATNILILCSTDHLLLVEVERELAYRNGWLVHRGTDPGSVPVVTYKGVFYLTADGAYVPVLGATARLEVGQGLAGLAGVS